MKQFLLTLALALTTLVVVPVPAASARTAPSADEGRGCVCPFYIFDYGSRTDGAFGARSDYSTLSVGTPGQFVVKIHGYELTTDRLNLAEVYFDVNRNNPGPEYVFELFPVADYDGVHGRGAYAMDTWRHYVGSVPCPRYEAHINYDTDVITMTIPKRCMDTPTHVRWSTNTWDFTEYYQDGSFYGYYDGVPVYHQFDSYWTSEGGGCGCRQSSLGSLEPRSGDTGLGSERKPALASADLF